MTFKVGDRVGVDYYRSGKLRLGTVRRADIICDVPYVAWDNGGWISVDLFLADCKLNGVEPVKLVSVELTEQQVDWLRSLVRMDIRKRERSLVPARVPGGAVRVPGSELHEKIEAKLAFGVETLRVLGQEWTPETTFEDQTKNGVRVIVTRTRNGTFVDADCQCYGNPGRAHSSSNCPVYLASQGGGE